MTRRLISGLSIAALALVIAPHLSAQSGSGIVSGTVSDSSDAAIANATVIVKNKATEVERTVPTNSSGFYNVPNLLPGNYIVSAPAPGFKTVLRSDVIVDVGSEQLVDLELPIGQVNERIQVTGGAPDIQQNSSSLDYTVNSTTVRELPLNGRDWTLLSLLQPGVSAADQSTLAVNNQRANRGLGTQLSIGGTDRNKITTLWTASVLTIIRTVDRVASWA